MLRKGSEEKVGRGWKKGGGGEGAAVMTEEGKRDREVEEEAKKVD